MAISKDLKAWLDEMMGSGRDWKKKTTVPEPDDISFGSEGGFLPEATVLYADLDGSTSMVQNHPTWFSAEIYQSYLLYASRIIYEESGEIVAYDGDRVMAIFIGDDQKTRAVRCAFKINRAVSKILNPAFQNAAGNFPGYSDAYKKAGAANFTLSHRIGIDSSSLCIAKVGLRRIANDLVWIGRAANFAAKLTTMPVFSIWITESVFTGLDRSTKVSNGQSMWTSVPWAEMNDITVYASDWIWGQID